MKGVTLSFLALKGKCNLEIFIFFNPLWTKFFFRRFLGHNLRKALFVYRLIGATLRRKVFWWSILKIELKFLWKGIPVILGAKGLMFVFSGIIIIILHIHRKTNIMSIPIKVTTLLILLSSIQLIFSSI